MLFRSVALDFQRDGAVVLVLFFRFLGRGGRGELCGGLLADGCLSRGGGGSGLGCLGCCGVNAIGHGVDFALLLFGGLPGFLQGLLKVGGY